MWTIEREGVSMRHEQRTTEEMRQRSDDVATGAGRTQPTEPEAGRTERGDRASERMDGGTERADRGARPGDRDEQRTERGTQMTNRDTERTAGPNRTEHEMPRQRGDGQATHRTPDDQTDRPTTTDGNITRPTADDDRTERTDRPTTDSDTARPTPGHDQATRRTPEDRTDRPTTADGTMTRPAADHDQAARRTGDDRTGRPTPDSPTTRRTAEEAATHRTPNGHSASPVTDGEPAPAPMFQPDHVERFRARWQQIQVGFVDDPREAVRSADELLAEVIRSLSTTVDEHKQKLAGTWRQASADQTEDLRQTLRRYRSFVDRLLRI